MNRLLEDVITAHHDSLPIGDNDAFVAAINALEKTLPVWQPIETAPKDGTLIDVWDGRIRVADVRWCQESLWSAQDRRSLKTGFCVNDPEYGWCLLENPTHWMPLPAPPEEG